MRISATDQVAVAWGQNADVTIVQLPYLDLGYTSLPLPAEWMNSVVLDTEKLSSVDFVEPVPGKEVVFTLNASAYQIMAGLDFKDVLPPGWEYKDDSTTIRIYDASSSVFNNYGTPNNDSTDPAITTEGTTQTLFWDLDNVGIDSTALGNMELGQTPTPTDLPASISPADYVQVEYTATITSDTEPGYNKNYFEAIGEATIPDLSGDHTYSSFDDAYILVSPLSIDKNVLETVPDADPKSLLIDPGGTVTYTIDLVNLADPTSANKITNLTVGDTLPENFSYKTGTTLLTVTDNGTTGDTNLTSSPPAADDPIITTNNGQQQLSWGGGWEIGPGDAVTISFEVDIAADAPPGTYDNTATATATLNTSSFAVTDDGTKAEDAGTPTNQDPEHDEDVTVSGGASIGDFVWDDIDKDGVQDVGETGLNNVTVTLYKDTDGDGIAEPGGDDGFPVQSITTDETGAYNFDGITPGDYFVVFSDLPDSYIFTQSGQGTTDTDSNADNNGYTPVFGLNSNEVHDIDAGAYQTSSIGDTVFQDNGAASGTANDGIQNGNESGIANVKVTLTEAGTDGIIGNADDVTIGTQTTDANGNYNFTGLAAGSYRVNVDEADTDLTNMGLTTGNNPKDITLAAGVVDDTADFGFNTNTGVIGATVFGDDGTGGGTAYNGIQDGTEAGIANISITLIEAGTDGIFGTADDVLIGTQTTDVNGNYSFTGLLAGNYRVDVDAEDTDLGDMALTTGNDPKDLTLADGGNETANFGFNFNTGVIGDTVFHDNGTGGIANNGIQEGTEPGIANVNVTLTEAGFDDIIGTLDDVIIGTQTTDINGHYSFTELPAGTYRVDVDQHDVDLGDMVLTTADDPKDITLAMGATDETADFGFNLDTHIGVIDVIVFHDDGTGGGTAYDGTRDGTEAGIANVSVNLIEAGLDDTLGTADDVIFVTQVTHSNGHYSFTGLPAGTYRVNVDENDSDLTGMGITTVNNPTEITLAMGATESIDFGFNIDNSTGVIGDTVFNDDGSGGGIADNAIQDAGETGIANVSVNLIGTGPDGIFGTTDDVILDTQTTDVNGKYSFTGLAAGTYRVDVDQNDTDVDGLNVTTGNDPKEITLGAAGTDNSADFGFDVHTGTIGDTVFHDDGTGGGTEDDGIQDGTEAGIANVTVTLIGAGDDHILGTADDVTIGTQTTDVNGKYSFTDLSAGNYQVEVDENDTDLAGMGLTTGLDHKDITLAAGATNNTADFGFDVNTGTIGDTVFRDNGTGGGTADNGIQDGAETGIANVTVKLIGAGDDHLLGTADDVITDTQTTDVNGKYSFTDIPAGLYRVDVDENDPDLAGMGLTTGLDHKDITLAAGATDNSADFGFDVNTGTIGDTVFRDNGTGGGAADNGIQEVLKQVLPM